jgi:hypothetical protein
MAVTLTSAGITFADTTTSTTKESKLGAVQYTGYNGFAMAINSGWSSTQVNYGMATGTLDPTTSVMCGVQSYMSSTGSVATNNDGGFSYGVIQNRTAYRSIS